MGHLGDDRKNLGAGGRQHSTCSGAVAPSATAPSSLASALPLWDLLLFPDTTASVSRQSDLSPFTTGPSSRSSMFIWRNRWERRVLVHTWSRLHAGPEMHLRTRGGAEGLGGLFQPPRGRREGQARLQPLACQHRPSARHADQGTSVREPQPCWGTAQILTKWDSSERNEPPAHTAQRV